MTTFTTTVIAIYTLPQVSGQANVVVEVYYRITGIDSEHTANISFSQQYTIQQGGAFTPYDQLTEAQVIGWVNSQTIAHFETCVQDQLNSKANLPVMPLSKSLPWAAQ
jgi:uncharacterized protein with ACT and thioredoxin-like domain